jgi:hypothetical protein
MRPQPEPAYHRRVFLPPLAMGGRGVLAIPIPVCDYLDDGYELGIENCHEATADNMQDSILQRQPMVKTSVQPLWNSMGWKCRKSKCSTLGGESQALFPPTSPRDMLTTRCKFASLRMNFTRLRTCGYEYVLIATFHEYDAAIFLVQSDRRDQIHYGLVNHHHRKEPAPTQRH